MPNSLRQIVLLLFAPVFLVACDMPPMDSTQQGFRGTSMAQISNPEDDWRTSLVNQVPEPLPPSPAAGPKAGDILQNVQVLGDLSIAQFTRMMTAITAWVSPEQGCTYCHAGANFADDDLYTKVVARRMLQMTMDINNQWKDHVGDTGVTCYTCHRGKNVPEYIWFKGTDDIRETRGMAASRKGQNLASATINSSSLPYDPFSALIGQSNEEAAHLVSVQSIRALPAKNQTGDMASTEETYALMIHMSQGLGVNCTHCHNSRAFNVWDQSNPARTTAWYGIRMARDLNTNYLDPLQSTYPENRLGVHGDAPKANCETCHQGVSKPMYGQSMLGDYPGLALPPSQ